MAVIPYGQLVTWGAGPGGTNLIFTGTGAISTVKSAWPKGFHPKYINPLINTGKTYPFDTLGYAPAPLDGPPQMQYDYVILAPQTDVDAIAFKYLRTQWNTIWSFFNSTYTVDGVTGATGQRGWLYVADEDPAVTTPYKAKARCLEPGPFDLVPGFPHELHITLTFALLSEFLAA